MAKTYRVFQHQTTFWVDVEANDGQEALEIAKTNDKLEWNASEITDDNIFYDYDELS